MNFDSQNDLERALILAAKDPAARPAFIRKLVESQLLIMQVGPIPSQPGTRVAQTGESIKIRSIDWNGKPHIPVFSSLLRLQQSIREVVSYLSMNALDLMRTTAGADLILNPGLAYGKEFTKEEIKSILDGSIWQPQERWQAEKSTGVLLGQPANYPSELVAALSRYFEETKEVKKAYLAHFSNPARNEKAHTLIAIEVTSNWESVAAGAGMVAQGVRVPDPPVDFLQLQGTGGVADYFIHRCKPFYVTNE